MTEPPDVSPGPSPATPATRRRTAVLAGHGGEAQTARELLADADPSVRAAALGALGRLGELHASEVVTALGDGDPRVRRRACEVAVGLDVDLRPVLADTDATVVEMAAWALGERGGAAADAVEDLARLAVEHTDALCREAAVAALGAIGHPGGLAAILSATTDKPAVRRRAIIALAPFDGPEVEAALRRARTDRDWQVRQAAEDLGQQDGEAGTEAPPAPG